MEDMFQPIVYDSGVFSRFGDDNRYYLSCPVPECGGSDATIAYGKDIDDLREKVYEVTDKYTEGDLCFPTHAEWKEKVEEALKEPKEQFFDDFEKEFHFVASNILRELGIKNTGYHGNLHFGSHGINSETRTIVISMKDNDHILIYQSLNVTEVHVISLKERKFLRTLIKPPEMKR